MKIKWCRKNSFLTVNDWEVPCSCLVRNELNGLRMPHEVVYSINKHGQESSLAVQPRPFPTGKWHVTFVAPRIVPFTAPFMIMTDANQPLEVWRIDDDGKYELTTGALVVDWGYGLHYSTSRTTLGCIKITNKKDLLKLVEMIEAEKEPVIVEVTDE